MGYLEINDLATAPSFRARVKMALVRYAGAVMIEDQGTKMNAHYLKRTEYARQVLQDPDRYVDVFMYPIISNVTIANEGVSTQDSSLDYQLSVIWDRMAGVTKSDVDPPPAPPEPDEEPLV